MTTPTQAQIEAAAKAICAEDGAFNPDESTDGRPDWKLYELQAKAALTAAAEECPGCKAWANRYAFAKGIYEKELSEAKAAPTGAAEVDSDAFRRGKDLIAGAEANARAEMKERCARLLDKYDGEMAAYYAAAIRAMKDS